MGKRKEANLRVRQQITGTLFSLMKRKPLSEISITELVEGAGVARASFYRNFSSKEDVLVSLIQDTTEDLAKVLDLSGETMYTYENILLSFQCFHNHRDEILCLYHAGLVSILLEELNRFHESLAGNMPSSSIEKYELYIYIGALTNTAGVWLLDGEKNTPEEMARFFLSAISGLHPGNDARSVFHPE